ncbi:hypothetical protein PROFUN_11244 [Planoprotostelium fungivorum]|uniref:Uncharacterized protein n=1 Tax=Planoprotostelium fungivorum TaxID=1890364 RepID=A0A2P6NA65_9EUKA|nr:hypothetical protein PROFUN_11244 [Planoprotostelium fungivorum]
MTTVQDQIRGKLDQKFSPVHLGVSRAFVNVINESYMHNVPKGSETHFKVVVVSSNFEGQGLVDRHRAVNELLSDELKSGVHALSILAKTPAQWEKSGGQLAWVVWPKRRNNNSKSSLIHSRIVLIVRIITEIFLERERVECHGTEGGTEAGRVTRVWSRKKRIGAINPLLTICSRLLNREIKKSGLKCTEISVRKLSVSESGPFQG